MGLWTSMDMFGLPLMGPWTSMGCQRWAVDIYGHVWVTINGSMDTWYGPGAVYSNPMQGHSHDQKRKFSAKSEIFPRMQNVPKQIPKLWKIPYLSKWVGEKNAKYWKNPGEKSK